MKKISLVLCLLALIAVPVIGNATEMSEQTMVTNCDQEKRLPIDAFSVGRKGTPILRVAHSMTVADVELRLGQPDKKEELHIYEFNMHGITYKYGDFLYVFFRGAANDPSTMKVVGFELKDKSFVLPHGIAVGTDIQKVFDSYGKAEYNQLHDFYYYEHRPCGMTRTVFYVDKEGKIVEIHQGTEL